MKNIKHLLLSIIVLMVLLTRHNSVYGISNTTQSTEKAFQKETAALLLDQNESDNIRGLNFKPEGTHYDELQTKCSANHKLYLAGYGDNENENNDEKCSLSLTVKVVNQGVFETLMESASKQSLAWH